MTDAEPLTAAPPISKRIPQERMDAAQGFLMQQCRASRSRDGHDPGFFDASDVIGGLAFDLVDAGVAIRERDKKIAELERRAHAWQLNADQYLLENNGFKTRAEALAAENARLRGALTIAENAYGARCEADEILERACAEGWDNDPSGSLHVSEKTKLAHALEIESIELRRAALGEKK